MSGGDPAAWAPTTVPIALGDHADQGASAPPALGRHLHMSQQVEHLLHRRLPAFPEVPELGPRRRV